MPLNRLQFTNFTMFKRNDSFGCADQLPSQGKQSQNLSQSAYSSKFSTTPVSEKTPKFAIGSSSYHDAISSNNQTVQSKQSLANSSYHKILGSSVQSSAEIKTEESKMRLVSKQQLLVGNEQTVRRSLSDVNKITNCLTKGKGKSLGNVRSMSSQDQKYGPKKSNMQITDSRRKIGRNHSAKPALHKKIKIKRKRMAQLSKKEQSQIKELEKMLGEDSDSRSSLHSSVMPQHASQSSRERQTDPIQS